MIFFLLSGLLRKWYKPGYVMCPATISITQVPCNSVCRTYFPSLNPSLHICGFQICHSTSYLWYHLWQLFIAFACSYFSHDNVGNMQRSPATRCVLCSYYTLLVITRFKHFVDPSPSFASPQSFVIFIQHSESMDFIHFFFLTLIHLSSKSEGYLRLPAWSILLSQ
jgi:hypothetical protein